MHMIKGVQVHGTGKKRKPKKLDMKALELEWRRYNKDMRRKHMHNCQFDTLDEYVDYVQGKPRKKKKEFETYAPPKQNVRDTKEYPSLKTSDTIPTGSTPRKEPQRYTGDLLVGIGTMHKSNMVPIMRGTNEAKDIARMRR
jgi:hypothetical protein